LISRYAFAVIAFLSSIYPFLHNTFLYCVNLFSHFIGYRISPTLNLVFIGWKDAVLIVALLAFLGSKRWWYAVLAAIGIWGCFLTDGLNGIKVLFEPLAVLICFQLHRTEVLEWFRIHREKALRVLTVCILGILAIGYADYVFRLNVRVEQDNWTEYTYLKTNNEYRCAKNMITGGAGATSPACLNSSMNFYKLDIKDGEYLSLPALFLPVGDSVVLSVLIFYFLIFYLYCAHIAGKPWRLTQALFALFLGVSVFKTLNRVNALVTLTTLVAVGILGAVTVKQRKSRWLYLGGLAGVVLFYYLDSHYLLLSLFNSNIPSNLGHADAFGSIRPGTPAFQVACLSPFQKLWLLRTLAFVFVTSPLLVLSRFRGWAACYVGFVAAYYALGWKIGVPVLLILKGYPGPSESDFAKGLALFGALGVAVYSIILSFMVWGLLRLFWRGMNDWKNPQVAIPAGLALMMVVEFLGYQFLAPYFISGYSIYGSFIGIWFVLSESLYERTST
jgi:hypothetical protein